MTLYRSTRQRLSAAGRNQDAALRCTGSAPTASALCFDYKVTTISRADQHIHDHDQQQHTASSRPWEGAHARRVNLERKGFLKAKSSRRQLGAQTSSTVIDDSENESDDDMDLCALILTSHLLVLIQVCAV